MSSEKETHRSKFRLEDLNKITWGIFLLVIGFLLVYCVSALWCSPPYTDVDSARYMLSALVQSEAAIVAIVITLSLVAVQLTASSYSPRVTEIFIKTRSFWFLMFLYISALSVDVSVLKMIKGSQEIAFTCSLMQQTIALKIVEGNPEEILELCIRISYSLGIICFLALIPYTLEMFTMLRPSTIINKLSYEIKKETILEEEDRIQPIIDIVRSSMTYETTKNGLVVIRSKVTDLLRNEEFEEDEREKISEKVISHFSRVGRLAVSREDEDSAKEVVWNVRKMGEVIIERRCKKAAHWTAAALENIGKVATEKRLEEVAHKAIKALENIGKTAAEKRLGLIAHWAVDALGVIGKVLAEKRLGLIAREAVDALGVIGKVLAEKRLGLIAHWTAAALENIGKVATEKRLKMAAYWVIKALENIGKTATEKKLGLIAEWIIEALENIGKTAAEKKLENIANQTTDCLEEIGNIVKPFNSEGNSLLEEG